MAGMIANLVERLALAGVDIDAERCDPAALSAMARDLSNLAFLLEGKPIGSNWTRCERCGLNYNGDITTGSRMAVERDIPICSTCGQMESIRDEVGVAPVPPSDWPVDADALGREYAALVRVTRASTRETFPPRRARRRRIPMIATTCDYCGRMIDDDDMHVLISVNGQVPSDGLCGREHEGGYIGHYHSSEREDGEPACYWRLRDAIDLVREWAGTLAELPVKRAKATPLGYRNEDRDGGES